MEKYLLNEFEQEILRQLFVAYYWDLQKTAFRIVRDQDDAQDIVQTVYANIVRSPAGIIGRNAVGRVSYLYYAVRAEAFRFIRSRSRSLETVLELQGFYTDVPSPEHYFEIKTELSALHGLSAQDKDLLAYRYILDYSYKEISKITGIKFTYVGSRLRKAKRKARELLQKGGFHD